jgi:hypothetical protein
MKRLIDLSLTSLLMVCFWFCPSGWCLPTHWSFIPEVLDLADQSVFPGLWLTFGANQSTFWIPHSKEFQTSGLFHLSACSLLPLWFALLSLLHRLPQKSQALYTADQFKIWIKTLYLIQAFFLISLMFFAWRFFSISASLYRGLFSAFLDLVLSVFFKNSFEHKPRALFLKRFLILTLHSFLWKSALHDPSFLLSMIGSHWVKEGTSFLNKTLSYLNIWKNQILITLFFLILYWPLFPTNIFKGLMANLWAAPLVNFCLLPALILIKLKPTNFLFHWLEEIMSLFYVLMNYSAFSSLSLKPWLDWQKGHFYLIVVLWASWLSKDFLNSFKLKWDLSGDCKKIERS